MSVDSDRAGGRRSIVHWGAAGLLAFALAGCGVVNTAAGESKEGSGDKTISLDSAAGSVTLKKPAARVAVLQWQFVEDLIALGVDPVMIADEQQAGSTNPLPTQLKGKLGKYTSLGSRTAPNMEVLASKPIDLIIADKTEHLQNVKQFSGIAPTLILDTNEWANFYPNLRTIAAAVGKDSAGAKLEKSIKNTFATAKQQLKADLKTLVAIPTPDKLFAFTGVSIQAGVMKELGLSYTYQDVPGVLAEQIPLETLSKAAPAALFLAYDPGSPIVTKKWAGNALWESIPAVKDGRVTEVDRSVWSVGRGAISIPMMVDETVTAVGKA